MAQNKVSRAQRLSRIIDPIGPQDQEGGNTISTDGRNAERNGELIMDDDELSRRKFICFDLECSQEDHVIGYDRRGKPVKEHRTFLAVGLRCCYKCGEGSPDHPCDDCGEDRLFISYEKDQCLKTFCEWLFQKDHKDRVKYHRTCNH